MKFYYLEKTYEVMVLFFAWLCLGLFSWKLCFGENPEMYYRIQENQWLLFMTGVCLLSFYLFRMDFFIRITKMKTFKLDCGPGGEAVANAESADEAFALIREYENVHMDGPYLTFGKSANDLEELPRGSGVVTYLGL
ncbi:hypothetical protein C0584_01235 [Candidatus Parcubacteria bacterium]|nr:MAG: hypothetical protein C0584_01235 [Candidatus Parcubacteria bacterium]